METRVPLTMPVKRFLDYRGNTAGEMTGPIVMPKELWALTRAEKNMLCGMEGLVAVGGRLPPNQAALLPLDGVLP